MQVGVADAAERDVDLHIVRPGLAALDVDGLERLVGSVRAVGFGHHGFASFKGRGATQVWIPGRQYFASVPYSGDSSTCLFNSSWMAIRRRAGRR